MRTPKWFDYSSLCYDELAVINRAANSPFNLRIKNHPNRPHTAALSCTIGSFPEVQLTDYMSFKRLCLTRINPLNKLVYAYIQGFSGVFTKKGER